MTIKNKTKARKYLEGITDGELTFSTLLKTLRQSDDLTQTEYAKFLGISKQYLCDIERGRKSVSVVQVALFAQRLGYPIDFFMEIALKEELHNAGINIPITVKVA